MRPHQSSGFGRHRDHGPSRREDNDHGHHTRYSSATSNFFSEERIRLFFLILMASTIFFSKLGLNGMANFDDCFYAQKAKEMVQSGNWLVQTFNHQVQFGNAPLYIWLTALSYKVFGVTVFAAKFPSALMGLATVLLTYFIGKFLFNSWTGFAAGVILSTTYTFFKYARHCMLDVTLAFFCALALFSVILAMRKNRNYFLLWGLAIGLAFLTKSALGLFPLIVTLLFVALDRQWKVLAWPAFWGGLIIQLGIMAWWCWSQYQANGPLFLEEHLRGVILQKAYTGGHEVWYQHFSFLVDMVIFNWLWSPLMAWGIWRLIKKIPTNHSTALFLLLWCLTLPVIMSLASYRMPWYLMQVFPALALAAASGLSEAFSDFDRDKWTRWHITIGTVLIILANIQPLALDADRERGTRVVAPYVKYFADKGAKVVGYKEDYYGLNNALLFFSDHAAQPILYEPGVLAKEFEVITPVLCVAQKGDLPEIQRVLKEWYPVKISDDLVLISNLRLDSSAVKAELN